MARAKWMSELCSVSNLNSTMGSNISSGLLTDLRHLTPISHFSLIMAMYFNSSNIPVNLYTSHTSRAYWSDPYQDATWELKECIEDMGKISGTPNLADFFPLLKWINPQRIRREADFYIGRTLGVIEDIINQRLESRGTSLGSPNKSDLLEALLDLKEGSEYELNLEDIKHLLLDLFFAGTKTTSMTVEWAMTELLLNPEKMASARKELRNVIGENKQVEESDISKLPYLRALIKETFRYHVRGLFLIPHKAEDEVKIKGYTIPKNAQILISVWAIGRDPSIIWTNPNLSEPERFLNNKVDFKGPDSTLLPFGSRRRICPGLSLADRMLHLMVASLIHNFDWKLELGVKEIDTSEKFGLGVHKAVPFKAIPIKVWIIMVLFLP